MAMASTSLSVKNGKLEQELEPRSWNKKRFLTSLDIVVPSGNCASVSESQFLNLANQGWKGGRESALSSQKASGRDTWTRVVAIFFLLGREK